MVNAIKEHFHVFPRYIGPNQRLVYSVEELQHQMAINSGVLPGFTSVYAFENNQAIIDKAFFDCDYGTKEETLEIGKKILKKALDYELECMPLWSGVRGPHIFPLFKPAIYPNASELLRLFSFKLIEDTGIYVTQEIETENGKETFKVPLVDSRVIGDTRRLCRYINTQRTTLAGLPLQSYCIPLDPDEFLSLSINDIKELSSQPQPYENITINKSTKLLTDFDFSDVDISQYRSSDFEVIENPADVPTFSQVKNKNAMSALLKYFIRPCICDALFHPNPSHLIRYSAVCEMRKHFSYNEIFNILKSLNWLDWNPEETMYQIQKIVATPQWMPVGKQRLTVMGYCKGEKCKNKIKCKWK